MFNPFNFTIEENNAMIAKGWEPILLPIPDTRTLLRKRGDDVTPT
jgi:hypothetical protein